MKRLLQTILYWLALSAPTFAAGEFQGKCPNGHAKEWKDWQANCWGYEGLLVDGYLTLLAVLDDTAP